MAASVRLPMQCVAAPGADTSCPRQPGSESMDSPIGLYIMIPGSASPAVLPCLQRTPCAILLSPHPECTYPFPDPFDSVITATARGMDLPLMTNDAEINASRLADVYW
jgi:hypothetical protein